MSESITSGIRVAVLSEYVPERSAPENDYYFFAYHIRISNEGDRPAQLVSRRWVITDGRGRQEVVEGPGVVGETPLLGPGESFVYTSFCPLPTDTGLMEGHYSMVRPNGERFEATIAPFFLAAPNAVN